MTKCFVYFAVLLALALTACRDNGTGPQPEEQMSVPFTFLADGWFCKYMGNESMVIRGQAEYDSLFGSAGSGCHPYIDFSRLTLLGQNGDAGGCSPPDYQISVVRNDSSKEVIFTLSVIQYGSCCVSYFGYPWILIPKVPESYTVVFEKKMIGSGCAEMALKDTLVIKHVADR